MFRVAHVSDLHVMSPAGVDWRGVLFNKRVTGYANLLMKRGRIYRREYREAVLSEAARASDHLVVTGDITNLSLEGEYEAALELLSRTTGGAEVTVVPGNHDTYLPSIFRQKRFPFHFQGYFESDLPEFALDLPAGRFPSVKLRGPVAIIALSSAVPRPPFVSAGYLGRAQLEALSRLLAEPEVARRTPVVLLHHGPFDDRFHLQQLQGGLVDAKALRQTLAPLSRGLVLYGHIHARQHGSLSTDAGVLDVVSATAAALDHADDRMRAGFNLYTFADDGRLLSLDAHVVDPDTGRFVTSPLVARSGP